MWYYIVSIILFFVSIVISMSVNLSFKKYSSVYAKSTGADAATKILNYWGIDGIKIHSISGNLTDNYNPVNKTLNLSSSVFSNSSVSAIAVAAHECGHALQDAEGYPLLKLRKTLIPIANFSSYGSYFIILLGILMDAANLITIGAILFSLIVLVNLVTLPVEIDASNRALAIIDQLDLVQPQDMKGCKLVLRSAGLTYFVALASSLLTLFRYISIANSRKRRD
ncbi:MAG: zinc metallopeptidase [Erysipelotrichaceae bacterium]